MDNKIVVSTICPIQEQDIFKLNIVESHNPELVMTIYDIINKNNIDKLTNYIKKNCKSENISILLNLIPYSLLIDWYRKYQIIKYYWNKDLINFITDKTLIRIHNNYINKNYELLDKELIKLNNSYNLYYNFVSHVFTKRLDYLQSLLSFLNLKDFYLSTNILLYLTNTESFKKKDITCDIVLYSKYNTISLNNKFIIINDYNNFEIKYNNLRIIINTNYYSDIYTLFLKTKEGLICHYDDKEWKIYCLPSFYQLLNNNKINYEKTIIVEDKSKNMTDILKFKMSQLVKINTNKCYECKKSYDKTIYIDTYTDFCLKCAYKNYNNKNLKANLMNMTFFVTGIRVKIGFATALKLLQNGAVVIGTSRLPHMTIKNFQNEKDYEKWKNNLVIIKVDFMNLTQVYTMLNILNKYKINGFINNACQTIRASSKYYNTVYEIESNLEKEYLQSNLLENKNTDIIIKNNNTDICLNHCNFINKYNYEYKLNKFKDIQDIPHDNSWNKSIENIDPKEIAEVVMINQLVPTLIISNLKTKLITPKFIIHVTALEGRFSTAKTDTHVHTNMCKSAMNMLIRTISESCDKDLYVYAINPGFVSGICPQKSNFPLTIEDGASRILYPIFKYKLGTPLDKKNVNLQNYEPVDW
jgi:NAD(P)-dependent dehydrogenase (short-subunit alcohol dehydrogenase family)